MDGSWLRWRTGSSYFESSRALRHRIQWLCSGRLKNNRRNPIQVLVTAPEGGAESVEVVHEIVKDAGSPPPASGWNPPPGHYSPVGESTDIQPHTDLLFNVPLNHVGRSWRLRIAYEMAGPKASPAREQEGTADFTWASVPAKEHSAWKKRSPTRPVTRSSDPHERRGWRVRTPRASRPRVEQARSSHTEQGPPARSEETKQPATAQLRH